jgi:alpha-ketoglutaric semialdehyde dehydrogenase
VSTAQASSVELASSIGGEWVAGAGREIIDRNPARPDEDILGVYRAANESQVTAAISAAAQAGPGWAARPIHERAQTLRQTARILFDRREALALELTREQGKTLRESHGEVARAIAVLEYNAALADIPDGEGYASPRVGERIWTVRQPLGVVSIITPWNVPLAIPAWKIAPALLFGNTVVWKPASLVPLLAMRFMQALQDAGLPAGVCNLVLADSHAASGLIARGVVHGCSFTGSTTVGEQLIATGAANRIKVQAEMGGKNAAIVFADADLEQAAREITSAAMLSTGQRCTATGRAIVAREIHDQLTELILDRARELTVGDPLAPDTMIGPLASHDQLDSVLDYFTAAVEDGASVLCGGSRLDHDGGGYYVPPTVATNVTPANRIFSEEVFGPLLAITAFDDEDHAYELANMGDYGLSGAVFTRSLDHAMRAIEHFQVGVLHVNSETCGADPHVPFGGLKASGTAAREMGTAARDFYTEQKTVYLRPTPNT